jgi:hypothetical protein
MFSRILTRSIVRSSIVEHGIGVTRALSNMGGHMITKTDKERKKTQRVRMTEGRDLRYKIQVDADIVAAVAAREDPLDLAPLRHHLATYVDYWSSSETERHFTGSGSFVRLGCMACGQFPVRLFVMTAEGASILPQDSSLWSGLRSRVDYADDSFELRAAGWLPLLNVYQALWRLSARSYFEIIPTLPLLYMPVLLLCDGCSALARRTHGEVALDAV